MPRVLPGNRPGPGQEQPLSPFLRPADFNLVKDDFFIQFRCWRHRFWHVLVHGNLDSRFGPAWSKAVATLRHQYHVKKGDAVHMAIEAVQLTNVYQGGFLDDLLYTPLIEIWSLGDPGFRHSAIHISENWQQTFAEAGGLIEWPDYNPQTDRHPDGVQWQEELDELNLYITQLPLSPDPPSNINPLLKPIYENIILQHRQSQQLAATKQSMEQDLLQKKTIHELRAEIWKLAADKTLSTDMLIQRLLERIGPFLQVSRACYNSYVDTQKQSGLVCSIEYCAEGVKPSLGTHIPQFLVKQMERREGFHVTPQSASNMLPSPIRGIAERMIEAITIPLDIKSFSILPHRVDGVIEGWFTLDICRSNPHYLEMTPEIKDVILEMVDIINNHIIQQRTQKALQKAYDEMEIRVEARTADLARSNRDLQHEIQERERTEQALRAAKEAAEAASVVKSQFLANVSHEIRTPLHAIIGFAEIILRTAKLDVVHEKTRVLLHEADSLLKLIDDLLDQASMEAGKLRLDPKPFDLHLMLEHIRSSQGGLAYRKGLDFKLDMHKSVPKLVECDELRLRQILINLIHNAVKFTSRGGVTVSVQTEDMGDQSLLLKAAISDTGVGIQEDKLKTIFESFTQADGSVTREYGGTGLGTTIARQIVDLMGGQMGVESTVNQGSTFWFEVPVLRPAVRHVDSWQPASAAVPAKGRKKARLLLVEDYAANQEVALMCLEDTGYSVDVADNGIQAVKLCQKNRYDLILMDVQMPEMDGHTATKKIRSERGKNKKTPVIGITAHASRQDKLACLEAGMNDVLTKPLHHDALLGKVMQWINGEAEPLRITPVKPLEARGSNRILDVDVLKEEFGEKRDWRPTVHRFMTQAYEQLEAMQQCIDSSDYENLRREAHALKGGSATLAAEALRSVAAEMEKIAQEEPSQAQRLLGALHHQLDELAAFMRSS